MEPQHHGADQDDGAKSPAPAASKALSAGRNGAGISCGMEIGWTMPELVNRACSDRKIGSISAGLGAERTLRPSYGVAPPLVMFR